MKKAVSLILACLILLSIGILPVSATTETELYPSNEEALAVGALTASPASNGGFGGTNFELTEAQAASTNSGVGVEVKKDASNNVYFELNGDCSRTDAYHSHKLFIYDYNSAANNTKVKKYSALVSVPSISYGSVNLFEQESWNTGNANAYNTKALFGFGVRLTKGGAYYYNMATSEYINFVPTGTMQANKFYRVEAIMDIRSRAGTSVTGQYYMRAFVYDGDTLLGETGWVHPSNEGYQYYLTGRSTVIDAYGFGAGSKVLIDEFKAYKLSGFPTYAVSDNDYRNETVTTEIPKNKYIAAKTANLWFRTVGERFNLQTTSKNNYIGDGSKNKAARYELSFRIPEFGAEHHFVDFIAGRNMLNSNTATIAGMAKVSTTGAFSANSNDGTDVALTAGTSYQLTENTWYNLELLVDYSTFTAPVAKAILKDSDGNVLTQTAQQYSVDTIPTSSYAQASIMWVSFSAVNKYIHFDNTKINIAPTYDELLEGSNLTTVIDDDFEVYEGDSATYYEVGAKYAKLVDCMHVKHSDSDVTNINDATVAFDDKIETIKTVGFIFEEGMTIPETKTTTLKFAYTNDIPNANISYKNVKLLAGDIELTPGVDYIIEKGNDGDLNDTSKTFTVKMPVLIGNTSYTVRLMAELSDYNTAQTAANGVLMGVPAKTGFYEDVTFKTPDDVKVTSLDLSIVDNSGAEAKDLAKGDVINAKATIANTGKGTINGYVILAVYEGEQLVNATISDAFSAEAGKTVTAQTEAITLSKDGLSAKAFVWNSLDLMEFLTTPVIVPAG
ncbi:MAG: hypothetical protein II978_04205 [Clostridia bacterium]|nr:hypothetical protein [Clostridia bacterium]